MPLKNDVKFTSSALDSDSDEESDVGSGVTLGFVDGVLSVAKEMKENSYCNKIGGFPTFSPTLTNVPDTSSSSCGVCNRSMPLIAQLFCPLSTEQVEGSGTGRELWHRLIYIWACVYKDCQRKEGRCVTALPLLKCMFIVSSQCSRFSCFETCPAKQERQRERDCGK